MRRKQAHSSYVACAGRVVRVFLSAWIGSFAGFVSGLAAFPAYGVIRSASVAALAAGIAAIMKLAQATLTPGEAPLPARGLRPRRTARAARAA
jgi:hypothetical protein